MSKHLLWIFLSAFILISCSGEASNNTKKNASETELQAEHYRLVIDAGSSGSRIYVYHISEGENGKMPEIKIVDSKKVTPGVSEFPNNPERVYLQMDTLLEFAQSKIDKKYWTKTELHLMATAGMRLLTSEEQNSTMEALTGFFTKGTPFDFQEAIVLSGQYEGLYGWTALNYLDDHFAADQSRESLLEMGGASTQIAFVSEDANNENVVHRKYGDVEFDLYAKSYLEMGQDRAITIAGVPACFPKGYQLDNSLGIGDFNRCGEEIVGIFNQYCAENPKADCLFNTAFKASDADQYAAISAFYYTLDFFGFNGKVDLDDLKQKGENFCGMSWEEVRKEFENAEEIYLRAYCFNASYFYTLFTQGYGMDNDFVIESKNDVDGSEITWTLGAALDLEMGYKPVSYE